MMAESTSLKSNTSIEDDANKKSQENVVSPTSPPPTSTTAAPAPPPKSPQEEAILTLQEAFPSVEREVIEAILESQRGNVNASFDILLGMSDPDYQASDPTANNNNNNDPTTDDDRYALEQQEKDDALLARQLAKEYDQQQQQQHRQENESVFSGFQEELPVIKERVIEAGNAAKKKIMGFYNSFMEQSPSNNSNNPNNGDYYSQPQQGGLANDMRGLRISSNQSINTTCSPPILARTSTGDQQLEEDAAFARRLAMEDAHLERMAAERQQRSVMQTTPPVDDGKKRIDVEECETVTFTTPDAVSTNMQKKDQRSAYVINDEDDDDIDYYGVDNKDISKDGQQQKDKQLGHQETSLPRDPVAERKQHQS